MSSEEAAAVDAIPSDIDVNGITDTLNNPTEIFRILDKNNDGRVTKEDLQLLLEQLGIPGTAATFISKYIFKQLDANNNGTIESSDLANAAGNIIWSLLQKKKVSGDY